LHEVFSVDLITQLEAAELKGCSLQAINNLVRRGRLKGYGKYGRVLVSRSEVVGFEPSKGGRPANPDKRAASQKHAGNGISSKKPRK
jgi:hypothetical protein